MRYKVCEDNKIFDSIDEVLDWCIDDNWHEDDNYFEEWVNEYYDGTTINGYEYSAYDIISEFNDGNYSDLKNDFCERMSEDDRENAEYELNNATPGGYVTIQGYEVEVLSDGDEDGDEVEFNVDDLRKTIEDTKAAYDTATAAEKEVEDDLMSLFQTIK